MFIQVVLKLFTQAEEECFNSLYGEIKQGGEVEYNCPEAAGQAAAKKRHALSLSNHLWETLLMGFRMAFVKESFIIDLGLCCQELEL